MVKNLPSNAGDMGLIPAQETEIPRLRATREARIPLLLSRELWSLCSLREARPLPGEALAQPARKSHVAIRNSPCQNKDPARPKGKQNEENNPDS